jgi:hypothetical protein
MLIFDSIYQDSGARADVVNRNDPIVCDYQFVGASYFSFTFVGLKNLPPAFILKLGVSGAGDMNCLEVKWVLADGYTVWWHVRRDFKLSNDSVDLILTRRHFNFAWGDESLALDHIKHLEVTVTGGRQQSGRIQVSEPVLTACNDPMPNPVVDSVRSTVGHVQFGDSVFSYASNELSPITNEEFVQIDFIFKFYSLLGGVVFKWHEAPVKFRLSWLLRDGDGQFTQEVVNPGSNTYHGFEFGEALGFRIEILEFDRFKKIGGEVILKPVEFGQSINALYSDRAQQVTRGLYPRYFLGQQCYWTITGVKGGYHKALLSEDGQVELGYELPMLEPFLSVDNDKTLLTWQDCESECRLAEEVLPLPKVIRRYKDLQLDIEVCQLVDNGSTILYINYQVGNLTAEQVSCNLIVALRPFLVNPPWQNLNVRGGHLPIYRIKHSEQSVQFEVDQGTFTLEFDRVPDGKGVISFWQEPDLTAVSSIDGEWEVASDIDCSAFVKFNKVYNANERASFGFRLIYEGHHRELPDSPEIGTAFKKATDEWRSILDVVSLEINADPIVGKLFEAQVGYIFTNQYGPWIRPGTRCYRRSWIRDGSLTSSALLRCGYHEDIKKFISAYRCEVTEDGVVPCVVDDRGPDFTPEYDSQGEFIYLLAEYYRYTNDRTVLQENIALVRKIAGEILRLSDSTLDASVPVYCQGLLPPSISHEGYSHKPAYSLWDNFWCMKGLSDAVFIAEQCCDSEELAWFKDVRDVFKERVYKTLIACKEYHNLSYIPGAADLGDFDPCSTTIMLDPCGIVDDCFKSAIHYTFDKYWSEFLDRQAKFESQRCYTPYEIRVIGTLNLLDMRDRAHEALAFFRQHSYPTGWYHFAEVVWGDLRMPRFIGDAPHGWVGSDYLRSIYSLFVREENECIYLCEGVPEQWWREGFKFRLRIYRGTLEVDCCSLPDGMMMNVNASWDFEEARKRIEVVAVESVKCDLRLSLRSDLRMFN